jgi:hypothetical protein
MHGERRSIAIYTMSPRASPSAGWGDTLIGRLSLVFIGILIGKLPINTNDNLPISVSPQPALGEARGDVV